MSSERKTILVVDAGSTKAAWGIAGGGESFLTKGVNALTVSDSDLASVVQQARTGIGDRSVGEIHWYGAGCATESACRRIKEALAAAFAPVDIRVSSDLVGAARALFGDARGIACILGTGSNSGYYDGEEIASQVPSLGYILGDEGSGVALGKRLVTKVLRGSVPKHLSEALGVDVAEVLERVYRSEAPNRYLASFVPFLAEHEEDTIVEELICEEFETFVGQILTAYPQVHEVPVGFVGSVAWIFQVQLEKALESFGLKAEKIIKDPMEGLLKYHA